MEIKDVIAALKDFALLLELEGESSFRVRAYENAARNLASLKQPLEKVTKTLRSSGIKGFGSQLTNHILDLAESGSFEDLDKLKGQYPAGILEIRRVRGLGGKKIAALHNELGIESIQQLEEACLSGSVSKLKGFGKKTSEKILLSIEELKRYAEKCTLAAGYQLAELLRESILQKSELGKQDVRIVGQLARGCETISLVELLVRGNLSPKLNELLSEQSDEALESNSEQSAVSGRRADSSVPFAVHFASNDNFAKQKLRLSSSESHWEELEKRMDALSQPPVLSSEKSIYFSIESALVPAELRETSSILELATKLYSSGEDEIPLLTQSDIKGVLHAHSTYSDGALSLKELALAVRERGYQYLGISDHSQSAVYAGGLKPDDIAKQHSEIDSLNQELKPFRVFKGIESDILSDGSLDYDDQVLASFDFVIASLHSGLGMSEEPMTERVLRAVSNPHTTILGHPTARVLLRREASAMDVSAILRGCAENDVVVEINANPRRLDLASEYHAAALEAGVTLSVNPDAHIEAGIDDVRYGVQTARRGGLRPEHILSALSLSEIEQYFSERKSR